MQRWLTFLCIFLTPQSLALKLHGELEKALYSARGTLSETPVGSRGDTKLARRLELVVDALGSLSGEDGAPACDRLRW